MKKIIQICFLIFIIHQLTHCQIYNNPLTMEGLNNSKGSSAISRALGGVTLTLEKDVSVMFDNPAILQSFEGVQFSLFGFQQHRKTEQSQHWFPLLYYPNFSLLMQGLSRDIPDPDTIRNFPPNAGDSVQRPFDNIEANWNYKKNKFIPMQFTVGIPFKIEDLKFSLGIGFIQYSNMNYYYANNNSLSPDFGSFRSGVFILPESDMIEHSKTFYWYQSIRERVGSIYGYGGALSTALSENIFLGISALALNGKTRDTETTVSRGMLRMYRNFFGVYRHQLDTLREGDSKFSGYEYTFSGIYRSKNVSVGISIKPPSVIKRNFEGIRKIDSAKVAINSNNVKSKSEAILPWRGSLGLAMSLRNNLKLHTELNIAPYSSAIFLNDNTWTKNWLDISSYRVGIEYCPISILALRAGFFIQQEVFEPEGNYIPREPISSNGYSAGFGLYFYNIRLNFTYEYLKIKYEDKWATNVNINNDVRQTMILSISYDLPFSLIQNNSKVLRSY